MPFFKLVTGDNAIRTLVVQSHLPFPLGKHLSNVSSKRKIRDQVYLKYNWMNRKLTLQVGVTVSDMFAFFQCRVAEAKYLENQKKLTCNKFMKSLFQRVRESQSVDTSILDTFPWPSQRSPKKSHKKKTKTVAVSERPEETDASSCQPCVERQPEVVVPVPVTPQDDDLGSAGPSRTGGGPSQEATVRTDARDETPADVPPRPDMLPPLNLAQKDLLTTICEEVINEAPEFDLPMFSPFQERNFYVNTSENQCQNFFTQQPSFSSRHGSPVIYTTPHHVPGFDTPLPSHITVPQGLRYMPQQVRDVRLQQVPYVRLPKFSDQAPGAHPEQAPGVVDAHHPPVYLQRVLEFTNQQPQTTRVTAQPGPSVHLPRVPGYSNQQPQTAQPASGFSSQEAPGCIPEQAQQAPDVNHQQAHAFHFFQQQRGFIPQEIHGVNNAQQLPGLNPKQHSGFNNADQRPGFNAQQNHVFHSQQPSGCNPLHGPGGFIPQEVHGLNPKQHSGVNNAEQLPGFNSQQNHVFHSQQPSGFNPLHGPGVNSNPQASGFVPQHGHAVHSQQHTGFRATQGLGFHRPQAKGNTPQQPFRPQPHVTVQQSPHIMAQNLVNFMTQQITGFIMTQRDGVMMQPFNAMQGVTAVPNPQTSNRLPQSSWPSRPGMQQDMALYKSRWSHAHARVQRRRIFKAIEKRTRLMNEKNTPV